MTVALTVLLIVAALRVGRAPLLRASVALLAVEGVQIAVGIAQARLGLPVILVGVHMVLACVLVAVMTLVVLSTKLTAAEADENAAAQQREAVSA